MKLFCHYTVLVNQYAILLYMKILSKFMNQIFIISLNYYLTNI